MFRPDIMKIVSFSIHKFHVQTLQIHNEIWNFLFKYLLNLLQITKIWFNLCKKKNVCVMISCNNFRGWNICKENVECLILFWCKKKMIITTHYPEYMFITTASQYIFFPRTRNYYLPNNLLNKGCFPKTKFIQQKRKPSVILSRSIKKMYVKNRHLLTNLENRFVISISSLPSFCTYFIWLKGS